MIDFSYRLNDFSILYITINFASLKLTKYSAHQFE